MVRWISILLFDLFFMNVTVFSQSISQIRKEKEKSEKQIAYLNGLLEEAAKDKSVSTEKLNILQQKIFQSKNLIHSLDQEVQYIQHRIDANEKRIGELQKDKKSLLDLYGRLVYATWKKRKKTNRLMFIFSSSDFNQAYNRFKYFQQTQEYSKRQLELIRQVNDSLEVKNEELKNLSLQKNETLLVINVKNRELESEQSRETQYIGTLQKKEREIKKKLKSEMQNRQNLARELDRLIARQTKKSGSSSNVYKLTPEEKLISDDFVKNKGKLPWPLAQGFVSEKFGVSTHPVYKRIETFNNGINITTSKYADVRAVFQGIVSEILYMPGFNNVVILRHGNYLTVYSNLMDVSVKKGAQVKTKDVIGKVAYDAEKGSILNFQVWKDTEKMNPELWLAK